MKIKKHPNIQRKTPKVGWLIHDGDEKYYLPLLAAAGHKAHMENDLLILTPDAARYWKENFPMLPPVAEFGQGFLKEKSRHNGRLKGN